MRFKLRQPSLFESLIVPEIPSRQTAARAVTAVLAVYWVVLLTATHWPQQMLEEEKWLFASDKVLHFSAYAGLGFLLMLVTRLWHEVPVGELSATISQLVRVGLVVSVAGLMDEATQPIVGRDFEWYDWLADAVGAAVGASLALGLLRLLVAGRSPAGQQGKT